MKRLLLIPVVILALGALILSACGGGTTTTSAPPTTSAPTTSAQPTTSAPTTTAAQGPIKVGHIVDLTGSEATVGNEVKLSLEYAFSEINNKFQGRDIQIVIGDAQGNPATAVDIAKKMVENDKVVAIFGPTQIGEKLAVANYMKSAGIPQFCYNPTPITIFTSGNKWIIGSGGSDQQNPTVMADYIYNQLGYRTIVTLSQDNSAGRAFLDPLTGLFKQLGGLVIQQQWVPQPCPDFTPYYTTMKHADALVAWDSGSDAIGLLTSWYTTGMYKQMPIVGAFHGGFLDGFIPKAIADSGNLAAANSVVGDLAPMMYSPDSTEAANVAFQNGLGPIMNAQLHFAPGDDGASGPYQAAQVFLAALKTTNGDTTPAKIVSAISGISIVGPEGPESFASGLLVATKNVYICKVVKVPVPNMNIFKYVTVYTYKDVPPTGYVPK